MTGFRSTCVAVLLVIVTALPLRAQVALDLRDADLKSFVEIVADQTGRNFILDPQVRGTVTVFAPRDISADALYEIFLNVLELNRLTIVQGVDADRIVPISVARELSPGIGAVPRAGSFETRVIRVVNSPIGDIVEVIRPLLPNEAVLSTVPEAGLIILSDRKENHTRIETLVRQLDRSRQQPIETIRLRNGNASEMLQVITGLNITPQGSSITADRRSNALLVTGSTEFRESVRSIVNQLDTPQRQLATRVVQLNYAKAEALADVIRRSFDSTVTGTQEGSIGVTIVAEPGTNSLLVTAPSDQISAIVSSIINLDRRPSQVLVEAVIFEMSVENFSDLSVQFGAIINDMVVGGVQFSLEGRPTLTGLVSGVLANAGGDPGNGGTIGGYHKEGNDRFGGFLSAVASQSSTRLLSTPSVMTLNNQEAEIIVAQNVPFVTGVYSTVGDSAVPQDPFQTIERQDVGLTLNVTPQINADNTIRMAIKQEVSSLTNSSSEAGGEITAKRSISTNVLVRDANVIMLGGLLENGSGSVGQEVPGLSKIPLLGGLFRGRNATKTQRVLLVMLRPRVIRSDAAAKRITREVARETKRAAASIQPADDGRYPRTPQGNFPFDGANLNQPFDAGFVDGAVLERNYPPLPSRLQFNTQ
ncbi:MAG: type II secretion system secretin GspD [Rhodobacteraceae bacterium]|nr:type II secretion system secretin GspD [Paracoccaceae bacterium]